MAGLPFLVLFAALADKPAVRTPSAADPWVDRTALIKEQGGENVARNPEIKHVKIDPSPEQANFV